MLSPYRLFIPEYRKIIGIAPGCINQNFDPSCLPTIIKRCIGLTYNVNNIIAFWERTSNYKNNANTVITISKLFPNGSCYFLETKDNSRDLNLPNTEIIHIKENHNYNVPLIDKKITDIDILCCDSIIQNNLSSSSGADQRSAFELPTGSGIDLSNCLESKCNRPKLIIYLSNDKFNDVDTKLLQLQYKILQVYQNATVYINNDVKEPSFESFFDEKTTSQVLNTDALRVPEESTEDHHSNVSPNSNSLQVSEESVKISVHEIEKDVTFITSIYPEHDIKNSRQIKAISSWIKNGINVVSVNTPSEATLFKSKIYNGVYDKVQFVTSKYSACPFTSKMSPSFNLMMKAASEVLKIHADHIIAIVNSDMYLHFVNPVHKFACMMGWKNLLRDNSVIIFNRREVSSEKDPSIDQGFLSDRLYGAIMFSSSQEEFDENFMHVNIPLAMGNPWLKTILVQSLIKSEIDFDVIYYETPFVHVSHNLSLDSKGVNLKSAFARRWTQIDDYYGLLTFTNMFPEIFARVNNDNRLIRDYVAQSLRHINIVNSTPDYKNDEYKLRDEIDWVMITSIQPSQVQDDIYAIKSWLNSGCKVVSLNNTADFIINVSNRELWNVGLSFVQFDDTTDKYPSLDKVLSIASEHKDSTIFLAPSSSGLWFLSKDHQEHIQAKIETLLSRKIDHSQSRSSSMNGFDLLIELQWEYESPNDVKILHGSGGKENDLNYSILIFKEVPSVPKNNFRFGYNWVDYFISWSLIESGKKVKILRDNICSYFKNNNDGHWNEYARKIEDMYPQLYESAGNSYSKMGDLMRDEIRYYSFVERRKTEKSQLVPAVDSKSALATDNKTKVTYTEWEKTHPIKKLDSDHRISMSEDFLKLYIDIMTEHKSDLSDIMSIIIKIPERDKVFQILDHLNKAGSLRRILLSIKTKDGSEVYNRLLYANSV